MEDQYQGKSPKMWVNEICVKMLVLPKYHTTMIPNTQPPMFVTSLIIKYKDRDVQVEANGKTKKDAEQGAAKKILEKLELTPASLAALNNSARRADLVMEAPANAVEEPVVSDTDEAELTSSANPIGDLLQLWLCNEFDGEPKYTVIKEEGPAHKKVFTMRCTVVDVAHDINISFNGRRNKKQTAKKLAALRVLRELHNRGYKSASFQGAAEINRRVLSDIMDAAFTAEAKAPKLPVADLSTMDISQDDLMKLQKLVTEGGGVRAYCDSKNHTCIELCQKPEHVFQHLGKSETLDRFLAEPDVSVSTLSKFGGAVALLAKICRELKVKQSWMGCGKVVNKRIVFLHLRYPFKFDVTVPKRSVHPGIDSTREEAKVAAATDALKYLKVMFVVV